MAFIKYGSLSLGLVVAILGISSGQSPAPMAVDEPAVAAPAPAPPAPAPVSAAVLDLRSDVGSIVRAPSWSSAEYGILVVSLDRGDTLYALNPDLPLAPASNMKLYTTAAALYYLGPEFRFSTYVLGDGEIRDSVLIGDVILYGTGDPTISGRMLRGSTETFEEMADSLLARGIRVVQGDVVGDGSYYDDIRLGSAWNDDDLMAWYAAPIGALSFAENVVSLRVLPGGRAGWQAQIETNPETMDLPVVNNVRTVASGATRVRFEHGPDGLMVTGQIRRGHPGVARSVTVVDPAQYAAAAFLAALESRGIEVTGTIRTVRNPSHSQVTFATVPGARPAVEDAARTPPRVLAVHLSPPLSEIVTVTNVESHNLFAEALLKLVGRVALGDGSWAGGAKAVQYLLSCETSVDTTALRIVDGSGLSRTNLVSARNTIRLLDFMAESDTWESYYASLPEAADRDGLRRMEGTLAAGNLRAKTGTIKNVSALSGYVRAANGERLAFSIIANNVPSTWRAKRTEDAIGARLAAFTRPRDVSPVIAVAESAGDPRPTKLEPDGPAHADSIREAPEFETYRVRQGDTLDEIARRYGVTVEDVQQANPEIDPRRLQLGQDVRIPLPAGAATAETSGRSYRIRAGDTLDEIARRNGVSVSELRRTNPGVDPRRLRPGQEITIPQ